MPVRNDPTTRPSVKAYEALLYLYPARFRRAFGPAMADAFGAMAAEHGTLRAWKVVGGELPRTLAREHAGDVLDRVADLGPPAGLLLTPLRVLLACAVPALACAWLLRQATCSQDVAVVSLWLAGISAGLVRRRGRGWASVRDAVLGALVGTASALAYDAVTGSPQVLSVAPLLLVLSGTAAFTVAIYVRLMMEGVDLTGLSRRASPRSVSGGW